MKKKNEGLSLVPFRVIYQDENFNLLCESTNREIKICRGAFLHLLVYKFGLIQRIGQNLKLRSTFEAQVSIHNLLERA